jgi:hypothetical protein
MPETSSLWFAVNAQGVSVSHKLHKEKEDESTDLLCVIDEPRIMSKRE